jgi:hypothetical protein
MGELLDKLAAARVLAGEKPHESIFETMATLGYQWGDVQKYITYMHRYPELADAYMGYLKSSMADMLAQAELICEETGMDFDDERALGRERFLKSDELLKLSERKS